MKFINKKLIRARKKLSEQKNVFLDTWINTAPSSSVCLILSKYQVSSWISNLTPYFSPPCYLFPYIINIILALVFTPNVFWFLLSLIFQCHYLSKILISRLIIQMSYSSVPGMSLQSEGPYHLTLSLFPSCPKLILSICSNHLFILLSPNVTHEEQLKPNSYLPSLRISLV